MKRLSLSATRRALEPALRRALHAYWRFARAMTLGVRALIIDEEGRIFLVKHSYVSGWHLPGGGVEAGETLGEALARELREEGNIEITAPPRLHGLFFNTQTSRRDHVAAYVVRDFRVQERGIVVFGARVITSDSDWKYVNVRRLFIMVETSIERLATGLPAREASMIMLSPSRGATASNSASANG